MNITVKFTAAESPFSNGLVKRQHDYSKYARQDSGSSTARPIALSWCLNVKNSLANVHEFSPFQLVFGQNPKLPSIFNDKASVLHPRIPTKSYLSILLLYTRPKKLLFPVKMLRIFAVHYAATSGQVEMQNSLLRTKCIAKRANGR